MKSSKLARILALILTAVLLCAAFASCSGNQTPCRKLEENFGSEYYGVGFRLGDNALTLRIQAILEEMAADGKVAEISTKWFGNDTFVKDAAWPRAIEDTGDDSLTYVLEKGTLILGLDETFPPMGFRDGADIVGYDVDLAREVCARLNIELVLQPISWSAKEMELTNKNIDCIWNGMSITDERVAQMNMSKPYIANRQVILVVDASAIQTKADLADKVVAVQAGSAALDAVNAETELVATFKELRQYDSYNEAYIDLKAGRVDALVVDEVCGDYMMAQDKK